MRTLDPAVKLIKEFEGFSSTPYLCPAGLPTIGYGSTTYPNGKKVTLQDSSITEAQGEEYLKSYIAKDALLLENFLARNKIVLNDNQFCALLGFSYNLGPAPIVSKGRSLNSALISKDHKKVCQAILLYNKTAKAGKMTVSAGLDRRRKAEVSLYMKGVK